MMSDGLTHDEMNRELGAKYAEKFGRAWCAFCHAERSTEGGSKRKTGAASRFCCRSCTQRYLDQKAARK